MRVSEDVYGKLRDKLPSLLCSRVRRVLSTLGVSDEKLKSLVDLILDVWDSGYSYGLSGCETCLEKLRELEEQGFLP